MPDISHLLPELLPAGTMALLRRELPNAWNASLDLSAKIQLARKLVKGAKGRRDDDEDDEEEQEVKVLKWRTTTARPTVKTTTPTTTTTVKPVWTVRTTRTPSWLATSTRWSLPQRGNLKMRKFGKNPFLVPPYFRQLDEHVQTNIVIPAGRTLRLSCEFFKIELHFVCRQSRRPTRTAGGLAQRQRGDPEGHGKQDWLAVPVAQMEFGVGRCG